MNFKNFLLGKEADFKGRTIQEIWSFSDIQIEGNHDFIQLIFPLNKKSQNVFHGYYLDNEDLINELKESHQIRKNIIKSSSWFLSFLKRNEHWKSKYDHNQLRITRVIECLRLLVGDDEADNFYQSVLVLCSDKNINKITLEYWKNS
tara:strand:- start:1276 stop:1716 length:441 start_codon:yes stop_codon:yes gene_type:complete